MYPFYSGNRLIAILAFIEDPDEIPHLAAFHQGLHMASRLCLSSE